jgi:anti-sigma regulatory factor (Ser/Thr protein kinase)
MATVELSFTALPAHVRTARLVATAVARRSGVDESLLDEVRLAVGEACSRAVEGHQLYCPAEPVRLALTDRAGRFEVEVTDTCTADSPVFADVTALQSGAGDGPEALDGDGLPAGLGIAVIESLADDVQIRTTSAGTTIRMSWPSARPAR